MVTENGIGSLNISWSFLFIVGVPVHFTLITTYLNASVPDPPDMNITGIQDQHYLFNMDSIMSCDLGFYSFRVIATTVDGISSDSSETITRSITSPPGVPLIRIHEYSLFKTADGNFILSINHQVTKTAVNIHIRYCAYHRVSLCAWTTQ